MAICRGGSKYVFRSRTAFEFGRKARVRWSKQPGRTDRLALSGGAVMKRDMHFGTGTSAAGLGYLGRMVPARRVAALAAGMLLVGGLTAAPAQAATAHEHGENGSVLDVIADNSPNGENESYRLKEHELQAGLVKVRLRNVGTVAHQLQLVRLHDGVTAEAYRTALLASHGAAALMLADAAGGPAAVEPRGRQSTYVNLLAGNYVALCFQSGGDHGAPHFAHGMFAAFTVQGRDEQEQPAGHVAGTIDAFSFGFHMPAVVRGNALYRFRNVATVDTHEMQLLKLAPGKTAADVLAWVAGGFAGPPPIVGTAGGGGALAPGGQMWVKMHLTPGNYVAVCFVPDDEFPHLPHIALGMVQSFQVV